MGLLSHSCLVVLVVVLLVPAALAVCTVEEDTDPCEPDCSICDEVGDKVPNPDDCHGYFACDGAGGYYDLSFDCDDGEVFVFNTTYQDCVEGDSCDPCEPKPATCHYECSTATSTTDPKTVPSFSNCNSYYECDAADNPTTSKTCDDPTKPFFDGEICQEDETHCCHCHPYCYTESTLIADPLDCRRYYLCTVAGENPTISGTCSNGNFDSVLGDCSPTAVCDTQCTNVLGEDGCIEPFTCLTTGYFARCPGQCTPDYYHCTLVTSEYQDVLSCNEGYLFHPDDHTCVLEDQCP